MTSLQWTLLDSGCESLIVRKNAGGEEEKCPPNRKPEFTELVTGAQPSPRTYFSMVSFGHRLFLFGGFGDHKGRFNDLWVFDTYARTWKSIVDAKGMLPSPLYLHTAVVYDKKMYIFGGSTGKDTNDIFSYSFEHNLWERVDVQGPVQPPARYGHSATVCEDRMYIVGGCKKSAQYHTDTYYFSFTDKTWKRVGDSPCEMAYQNLCTHNGKIYLFGGFNGKAFSDKLYCMDTSGTWSEAKTQGKQPEPRCGSTVAVVEDTLFVYGGFASAGPNTVPSHTNDLFTLDFATLTWSEFPTEDKPKKRAYLQSSYSGGRIYIFGGYDGIGCLRDFRSLQLTYNVTKALMDKPMHEQVQKVMEFFSRKSMGTLSAEEVEGLLRNIITNIGDLQITTRSKQDAAATKAPSASGSTSASTAAVTPFSSSSALSSSAMPTVSPMKKEPLCRANDKRRYDFDTSLVESALPLGFTYAHIVQQLEKIHKAGQNTRSLELLMDRLLSSTEEENHDDDPPVMFSLGVNRQSSLGERAKLKEQLASALEEKDNLRTCKVCFDEVIDCVLRPCGHLCVCSSCSESVRKACPICRVPVQEIIKSQSSWFSPVYSQSQEQNEHGEQLIGDDCYRSKNANAAECHTSAPGPPPRFSQPGMTTKTQHQQSMMNTTNRNNFGDNRDSEHGSREQSQAMRSDTSLRPLRTASSAGVSSVFRNRMVLNPLRLAQNGNAVHNMNRQPQHAYTMDPRVISRNTGSSGCSDENVHHNGNQNIVLVRSEQQQQQPRNAYSAIQSAHGERSASNVRTLIANHYVDAAVEPKKHAQGTHAAIGSDGGTQAAMMNMLTNQARLLLLSNQVTADKLEKKEAFAALNTQVAALKDSKGIVDEQLTELKAAMTMLQKKMEGLQTQLDSLVMVQGETATRRDAPAAQETAAPVPLLSPPIVTLASTPASAFSASKETDTSEPRSTCTGIEERAGVATKLIHFSVEDIAAAISKELETITVPAAISSSMPCDDTTNAEESNVFVETLIPQVKTTLVDDVTSINASASSVPQGPLSTQEMKDNKSPDGPVPKPTLAVTCRPKRSLQLAMEQSKHVGETDKLIVEAAPPASIIPASSKRGNPAPLANDVRHAPSSNARSVNKKSSVINCARRPNTQAKTITPRATVTSPIAKRGRLREHQSAVVTNGGASDNSETTGTITETHPRKRSRRNTVSPERNTVNPEVNLAVHPPVVNGSDVPTTTSTQCEQCDTCELGGGTIECSSCSRWYHYDCLEQHQKIQIDQLKNSDDVFSTQERYGYRHTEGPTLRARPWQCSHIACVLSKRTKIEGGGEKVNAFPRPHRVADSGDFWELSIY